MKKLNHIIINTIIVVIIISMFFLFIGLGFWQLNRANEKKFLLVNYQQQYQQQPWTLEEALTTQQKSNANYHPIKITGYYDNQHQFLLENKFYQHQLGYQVITPFIVANQQVVFVNRGWIMANKNRKFLPKLDSVEGVQTIQGLLFFPSKKQFVLNKQLESTTWPMRITTLDDKQLAGILNVKSYPFILLLNPNESHGFVRSWYPVVMPPQKHVAYAVQWFALAGVFHTDSSSHKRSNT